MFIKFVPLIFVFVWLVVLYFRMEMGYSFVHFVVVGPEDSVTYGMQGHINLFLTEVILRDNHSDI